MSSSLGCLDYFPPCTPWSGVFLFYLLFSVLPRKEHCSSTELVALLVHSLPARWHRSAAGRPNLSTKLPGSLAFRCRAGRVARNPTADNGQTGRAVASRLEPDSGIRFANDVWLDR